MNDRIERKTPEIGEIVQVRVSGVSKRGDNAVGVVQNADYAGLVVFLPLEEAQNSGVMLKCQINALGKSVAFGTTVSN